MAHQIPLRVQDEAHSCIIEDSNCVNGQLFGSLFSEYVFCLLIQSFSLCFPEYLPLMYCGAEEVTVEYE